MRLRSSYRSIRRPDSCHIALGAREIRPKTGNSLTLHWRRGGYCNCRGADRLSQRGDQRLCLLFLNVHLNHREDFMAKDPEFTNQLRSILDPQSARMKANRVALLTLM